MTTQGHGFSLEFDIPYRDLGWHGVPHREMVFIQPTVNCLVNLTEMPFFIVEVRVFFVVVFIVRRRSESQSNQETNESKTHLNPDTERPFFEVAWV